VRASLAQRVAGDSRRGDYRFGGFQQRQLARSRAAQQLGADHDSIDLVRAFVDARDASVTISPLGWIVLRVTVATEDLNLFVDDVSERLALPDLDDRAFDCELLEHPKHLLRVVFVYALESFIDHPKRSIQNRFAGVSANCHLRELVFDQTKVRDGLAELMTLFGVLNRLLERKLDRANRSRA